MTIDEFMAGVAPMMRKGWIAMDANGLWFWYSKNPTRLGKIWTVVCGNSTKTQSQTGNTSLTTSFYVGFGIMMKVINLPVFWQLLKKTNICHFYHTAESISSTAAPSAEMK